MFSRAIESKQRVILNRMLCGIRAPAYVPREKPLEPVSGKLLRFGKYLSALSSGMVSVAKPENTPSPGSRLIQHSVSPRVGRSIGDAVLDNVHVKSWTQRAHR